MDTTMVGVDLTMWNVFVACVVDCAGRIVERRKFSRGTFCLGRFQLASG